MNNKLEQNIVDSGAFEKTYLFNGTEATPGTNGGDGGCGGPGGHTGRFLSIGFENSSAFRVDRGNGM